MKIKEFLDSLPPGERERMLGRIEGMEMAMRICRNRAHDAPTVQATAEAINCSTIIRFVQVSIANGTMPFGEFSADEQDEIWRIY